MTCHGNKNRTTIVSPCRTQRNTVYAGNQETQEGKLLRTGVISKRYVQVGSTNASFHQTIVQNWQHGRSRRSNAPLQSKACYAGVFPTLVCTVLRSAKAPPLEYHRCVGLSVSNVCTPNYIEQFKSPKSASRSEMRNRCEGSLYRDGFTSDMQ